MLVREGVYSVEIQLCGSVLPKKKGAGLLCGWPVSPKQGGARWVLFMSAGEGSGIPAEASCRMGYSHETGGLIIWNRLEQQRLQMRCSQTSKASRSHVSLRSPPAPALAWLSTLAVAATGALYAFEGMAGSRSKKGLQLSILVCNLQGRGPARPPASAGHSFLPALCHRRERTHLRYMGHTPC